MPEENGWVAVADSRWRRHATLDLYYDPDSQIYFRLSHAGEMEVVAMNGMEMLEATEMEEVAQEVDDSATEATVVTSFVTSYASASALGGKETNEDRFVNNVAMGALGQLFGIYDGHGGEECAVYLTQQLHHSILRCYNLQPSEFRRCPNTGAAGLVELVAIEDQLNECRQQHAALKEETELHAQLSELMETLTDQHMMVTSQLEQEHAVDNSAFEESVRAALDTGFQRSDRQYLQAAKKRGWQAGSTAIVALLHGTDCDARVFVANAGDCRAVLCRAGKAIALSEDHKPERSDEQRRIRQAGGAVVQLHGVWRVTSRAGAGELNLNSNTMFRYLGVARGFGDPDFKEPLALLTAQPDIRMQRLQMEDSLLVLACDGIYDVLTNQMVIDTVLPHLDDPKQAANALIKVRRRKKGKKCGEPDAQYIHEDGGKEKHVMIKL